jgi:hypothetical protein
MFTQKTCINKTYFTVPYTKYLCNFNLCKPNTCLNWTNSPVPMEFGLDWFYCTYRFREVLCLLGVRFIQVFCLLRVRFRQVFCLLRVRFTQVFGLLRVRFRQVFGLLRVRFRQVFGLLRVRFRQVFCLLRVRNFYLK